MAKTLIENLARLGPRALPRPLPQRAPRSAGKKAKGKPLPEPKEDEGGEVVDLMEALRQSVAATKKRARAGEEGGEEDDEPASGPLRVKLPRVAAERIPQEAGPEETPEPFWRRGQARHSRSSSCSATTRAGCTTTSASRRTERSPPGRCRKACRSSPARRRSPCTSRTTRSSTRRSTARSPGPVRRWDGRDLRQRHLGAARGEAERPAHVRPARPEAQGPLVARAGAHGRKGAELAADQAP